MVWNHGEIPEDILEQLAEVTDYYEDENAIDNYNEEVIRDTSADPMFHASDETRGEAQHNNYRTYMLGLHGVEGERFETPNHSEQWFGHGPDQSGNNGTPSYWRLARKYTEQRKDFLTARLSESADGAVPDRFMSNQEYYKNRDLALEQLRNRLKVFSTSVEAYNRRYNTGAVGNDSRVKDTVIQDLVIPDGPGDQPMTLANSLTSIHRGDNTVWVSNNVPIGWRSTTDHKFKVSKYDRPVSRYVPKEHYSAEKTAVLNHKVTKQKEGEIHPKNLLLGIENYMRQKRTQLERDRLGNITRKVREADNRRISQNKKNHSSGVNEVHDQKKRGEKESENQRVSTDVLILGSRSLSLGKYAQGQTIKKAMTSKTKKGNDNPSKGWVQAHSDHKTRQEKLGKNLKLNLKFPNVRTTKDYDLTQKIKDQKDSVRRTGNPKWAKNKTTMNENGHDEKYLDMTDFEIKHKSHYKYSDKSLSQRVMTIDREDAIDF